MIKVLDTATANGIAAGEVVERPASVVKELVENAIDAGADRIRVQIEGGGIRSISVSDNGCGMNRQDAMLCFLRHSTSKLRNLEDLNALGTLGFRGEALASIAAVSKVSLRTRERGSEDSFRLELEAGVMSDPRPFPGPYGSDFIINELFYNVPARFKFLKKDSTEAAYVQDLMERLAFTRPDISFRLHRDHREVLLTPGDQKLLSCIYAIWGKNSAEAAVKVEGCYEQIQISGYISQAYQSRKNRSRQIFIVNGRVIQSMLLRAAIDQACQGHYVRGQFPEIVLCLELPPSLIDVNIHPQKTELRFADEKMAFRAVYTALRESLEKNSGIREIAGDLKLKAPVFITGSEKSSDSNRPVENPQSAAGEDKGKTYTSWLSQKELPQQLKFSENLLSPVKEGRFEESRPSGSERQERMRDPDAELRMFTEAGKGSGDLSQLTVEGKASSSGKNPEEQKNQSGNNKNPDHESGEIQRLLKARIIGQLFHTYFLLEDGENLLLIDQHAAHERVLYEQLLRQRSESNEQKIPAQPLLKAILLQLSPLELEHLAEESENFEKAGFIYERFSEDSILLRAVPQTKGKESLDPEAAFRSLLEWLMSAQGDYDSLVEDALHSMACKAAVKAHDLLSYEEMKALLSQLQDLNDPFHCPHGRPVILKISRYDIEKMFGRII